MTSSPELAELETFITSRLFRDVGIIGEGGFAKVYKAFHVPLNRPVAIKILKATLDQESTALKRFIREGRTIQRITHPNLVKVFAMGCSENGFPYIVMEYLVGQTVANAIAASPLTLSRSVEIITGVLRGTAELHRNGVIHRDLTATNCIITTSDGIENVKIIDFGLVRNGANLDQLQADNNPSDRENRLTAAGSVCGTVTYASPEVCLGRTADERSDIYSLGCLFYFMLAGRLPFVANTLEDVMVCHLHEVAPLVSSIRPNSDIPKTIDFVIARALSKLPSDRYQSADDFAAAILAAASGKLTLEDRRFARNRQSGGINARRFGVREFAIIAATALLICCFLLIYEHKSKIDLQVTSHGSTHRQLDSEIERLLSKIDKLLSEDAKALLVKDGKQKRTLRNAKFAHSIVSGLVPEVDDIAQPLQARRTLQQNRNLDTRALTLKERRQQIYDASKLAAELTLERAQAHGELPPEKVIQYFCLASKFSESGDDGLRVLEPAGLINRQMRSERTRFWLDEARLQLWERFGIGACGKTQTPADLQKAVLFYSRLVPVDEPAALNPQFLEANKQLISTSSLLGRRADALVICEAQVKLLRTIKPSSTDLIYGLIDLADAEKQSPDQQGKKHWQSIGQEADDLRIRLNAKLEASYALRLANILLDIKPESSLALVRSALLDLREKHASAAECVLALQCEQFALRDLHRTADCKAVSRQLIEQFLNTPVRDFDSSYGVYRKKAFIEAFKISCINASYESIFEPDALVNDLDSPLIALNVMKHLDLEQLTWVVQRGKDMREVLNQMHHEPEAKKVDRKIRTFLETVSHTRKGSERAVLERLTEEYDAGIRTE